MRYPARGIVTAPRKGQTRALRGRPRKHEGIGWAARAARMIAVQIAEELRDEKLDGPHARRLILEAALRCPLVRTPQQAQALVAGWEGQFYAAGTSPNLAICRSAGRQLAVLKGVLS